MEEIQHHIYLNVIDQFDISVFEKKILLRGYMREYIFFVDVWFAFLRNSNIWEQNTVLDRFIGMQIIIFMKIKVNIYKSTYTLIIKTLMFSENISKRTSEVIYHNQYLLSKHYILALPQGLWLGEKIGTKISCRQVLSRLTNLTSSFLAGLIFLA